MAPQRGIGLDGEHARRVAEGEITLSALAGELGCSRQSIFTAFKRRNWATKAAPAATHQAIAPRPPRSRVQRQKASAASSCQPASNCPPAASAEPVAAIPVVTAAELAEFARQSVAGVALLALDQLVQQLGSQKLGPGALKSATQAAGLAADLLDRAGLSISGHDEQQAPKMIFEEYTAEECENIRARAEAEQTGLFMQDDDLLESDQSSPQQ